ncbi:cadherin-like protein 26 isoform X2 [Sinocyclocheilus anshuiensis]|uniref:cadherin-like protein 26 isoform X2 n=1 Tax=Sinocyclocheilus anshuiensis TaxID=1608454 RepID=UPI0007B928EA|nr:PREDICTED: cadherin-like protein 26 isoform X2 [Sinocyclocheilus anshuiensis]
MTKSTLFLILLALVDVAASSKKDTSNREKRDAVLIRSKRRWVLSTIDLEENMPGPYPAIVTQMYNDKKEDNSVKFRIKGDGVTQGPIGLFTIEENSGIVYVHRPIDRETNPIFHVDFDVLDRLTGATLDKTLSFNVEIKDKNDNSPQFTPSTIHAPVPENTPEGVLQAALQAHDIDLKDTPNSQFTMKVVSQDPASPKFTLKDLPSTTTVKQLAFTGCFDYDKTKQYKVLVEARDQGTPTMSSTATVIVDITDSNTHPPEFSSAMYNTEVMEMELKEILRIGIKDKDTPNMPGSRAVFSILKGNEEGNYKIETDSKTNEGVLSVIKGKNFEKTEVTELEIAVENEEKLFRCVDGKAITGPTPKPNTAKVSVKVIDVNDPPVFKKQIEKVYRNENGPLGDVLFVPEIKDEDSDVNKLRYELVQDPAKWVSVDSKTGKITTVQKMDRESSFIKNGTYTVVVHAIDDGQPPATGTCTVVVYLGDQNDNAPYLVSKNAVMCGNKVNRVDVKPTDLDGPPFAGPFTFSLGGEEELKSLWKLDPTTGTNTSLISLTSLPYGSYSVPLKIQDQQGLQAEDVLQVVVCECTGINTCRGRLPFSSRLGPAAIGLLFAGLLLLALLLLFCFLFECQSKNFQHIPLNLQDEGNQTLVKYNEEGGGSIYKPVFWKESLKTPSTLPEYAVTDGYRKGENGTLRSPAGYNFQYNFQEMSSGGGVMSMPHHNWSTVQRERNESRQMSRSYSLARTERNLAEHIERKISGFPEEQRDYPAYSPYQYEYEGRGSDCQSLDQLTVSNLGDNLDFLQNLGPKFSNLGGICQQSMERRNVRL